MARLTLFSSLLATATIFTSLVSAQGDPNLTGTWTTKSRKVVTGPGFYDPVGEKMFEPDLTGFSYSFTADGHYEEAYYRAISNPTDPACPQGIIQWQHGTYVRNDNGSLTLTPIAVDGRQLLSDPCQYSNSIYTRYNQTETFKSYEVLQDSFSKAQRLNLFAFDGAPLNPMYLAFSPPQMLPTNTLHPATSATKTGQQAESTGKLKKRHHGGDEHLVFDEDHPLNRNALVTKKARDPFNADRWWWIGVGMTALGGIGYYCF